MSFNFLKKNATTRSYPTDILIGELFVKAGVISQKQLDDTVRAAGSKHLHIGQMLTMSGMIQHRDLQAAVDAQSMLRDKVIDMAMASRCLKVAVKTGASFGDLVREEIAIENRPPPRQTGWVRFSWTPSSSTALSWMPPCSVPWLQASLLGVFLFSMAPFPILY